MKEQFNLTKDQIVLLSDSFQNLVSLASKANGYGVARIDLFRMVLNRAIKGYGALKEDTTRTPLIVVADVIGKLCNEFVGQITGSYELKDGESIAREVRLSTSTGAVAYYVGKPLPFIPGKEGMVKSLAKRATKPGKAFALETRKGNKVSITTYVVDERVEKGFAENGEPFEKKVKVATKATGWVRLYHPSEQAFKKGLVKGLMKIA